jgi:hypothetical protein
MGMHHQMPVSGICSNVEDSMNDDTIKLAIRDEVEKRVEHSLKIYSQVGKWFVALIGVFIAVFSYAIWKVQMNEVRAQIAKTMAEQKVTEAKDRILAVKSETEAAVQKINAAVATVETNQQDFLERLAQIRQQDNVVLKDDVSKLFVSQAVTNFDGKQLILDYEPIPYSIRVFAAHGTLWASVMVEKMGYVRSNVFILTNGGFGDTEEFRNGSARVEYLRKSLR